MKYMYEILLQDGNLKSEHLKKLFDTLSRYHGFLRRFHFCFVLKEKELHIYIQTNMKLPVSLDGFGGFLFQEKKYIKARYDRKGENIYFFHEEHFCEVYDKFYYKKGKQIVSLEICFINGGEKKLYHQSYLYYLKNGYCYRSKCFLLNPVIFFAFDISKSNRFVITKIPNFFNIQKQLNILSTSKEQALMEVSAFPYIDYPVYLSLFQYDFFKHSLILGGSGSGKSKFLSLFIHRLLQSREHKNYKVIVIDPHASLELDIGGLSSTTIIDFEDEEGSISLFSSNNERIISDTELYLSLFSMLMGDLYQPKLERVLRFSLQLLLSVQRFTFENLRKLLLESDYRNDLLKDYKGYIETTIESFFLKDFYDLKTKSYNEAISPIISFLDEMQSVPIFNINHPLNTLEDIIQNNFLVLFSLSRKNLGDRILKVIAGFLMCQVMTYVQNYQGSEEFLFIIDEVAVVENPILCRFLSEARKYHVAVVLVSQYLNQVSKDLKDAIVSNVVNYYLFRISYFDADFLVDHMNMSLAIKNEREEKIKVLTGLSLREGVAKVQKNGKILPAMKFKTLDFEAVPRILKIKEKKKIVKKTLESNVSFKMDHTMNIQKFMSTISPSHKKVR